ncbi:latrophilin Cirl-like isoform X4 [Acropora muricata]|uniref:latrophilin Cirl-like isoform X4 n=1 Tax=Acropora muricata TaxID=159855 RepID=UPI0034E38B19
MTLAASKGIVLILVSLFHFGNFGHKANAWDFSTSSVIPDIKVVCQGERSRLQCDSASEKLIIYSAMFGRTEPGHVICPYEGDDKDDNYNCGEVDFTYWFKLLCENKTRCKIKVDNEVFKNPCPEQHLYLQLVFSCVKKYSTASTESATTNMPTLSTTAPSSFSSVLILPTTSVMAVASTSTVLVTQPTMTTQKSPKVHSTTSEGGKLPGIIPQQVENTGSSAVETGNGSLGVAGALFVWFLFWQDHSTDYAMVFLLQRRVPLLWRSLLVFVCFTFIVKASSISTKQAIQSSRLMK